MTLDAFSIFAFYVKSHSPRIKLCVDLKGLVGDRKAGQFVFMCLTLKVYHQIYLIYFPILTLFSLFIAH